LAPAAPGSQTARLRVRLLAGLLVWLALELGAWAAGRALSGSGLFYAPRADAAGYAAYLAQRDPELGWPAPSSLGRGQRDARGARRDPAFPPEAPPCVALYGDSQTWGDEVAPGEAWGSRLARRLGCRVENQGVGGYGTDQALLRYLSRDDGQAGRVVLGHWSENVLRNVNQYRELLYSAPFGFKPRFVLESGALREIPLPTPDAGGFERLLDDPASGLHHEFFLPGTRWGEVPLRFPWSLAVLRAAGHFRVRAWLAGEPAYARFYAPDHPSGALALTTAILRRFREEARRRGQLPTVLLIPTGLDLAYRVRTGRWTYAPLARRLEAEDVEFLDAGPPILDRIGDRDPCSLFRDCSAHFGPEGNALLAEVVFERLCRDVAGTAPLPGCAGRAGASDRLH